VLSRHGEGRIIADECPRCLRRYGGVWAADLSPWAGMSVARVALRISTWS